MKNYIIFYISITLLKANDEVVLYLLNSLPLNNSEAEFVDEDYTIEIKGENTYIIYMKENLLLINDVVYNTNTHEVENVKKEISNLISN